MRTVIQRVAHATVTVAGEVVSEMGQGLLVLVGIAATDGPEDIVWLAKKIVNLRIFDDQNGTMNRSVLEIGGEITVVSQFTLHALTQKGNRPSYIKAAKPVVALPLYEAFVGHMAQVLGKPVGKGIFGADMQLALLNDGPVTLLLDTQNRE